MPSAVSLSIQPANPAEVETILGSFLTPSEEILETEGVNDKNGVDATHGPRQVSYGGTSFDIKSKGTTEICRCLTQPKSGE